MTNDPDPSTYGIERRVPYAWVDGPGLPPGPGGARLLCHIVVNVEHWPLNAAAPRAILPAPHGRRPVPDVPNVSWAEHGVRVGLPRILRSLHEQGVIASTSCNGGAVTAYPAAVEAMSDAGWEFIGHGLQQRSLQDVEDERATIEATLDLVAAATGTRPRGWLGPGLQETSRTPDHLAAAGVEYVCDWVLDDRPVPIVTSNGPLVAMPYTLDLNDSVVYAVEHHSAEELLRRLEATLDTLGQEAADGTRVLTLALHPHLIGAAHRIAVLGRMIESLQVRSDTRFLTGSQILDWYTSVRDAEPT